MPCFLVSRLSLGSCSPLSLNICLRDFSETLYEYALLQRRSCLHLPGSWGHLVGTTSDPARPGVLGATWVICCARTSLWSPLLRVGGLPAVTKPAVSTAPRSLGAVWVGLVPKGSSMRWVTSKPPSGANTGFSPASITPKRLRAEVQGQGGGHP